MTKRALEVIASLLLVLALAAAGGGFWYYRSLNDALVAAIQRKDKHQILVLLRRGASIHSHARRGDTALHIAFLHPHDLALAREALSRRAEVGAMDEESLTPLHLAATKDGASVKLLLEHGANVNHASNDGQTPLMFAASSPDPQTVHRLVAAGAGVHARDSSGATPLHYAVGSRRLHHVLALLNYGADINATGTEGDTPLMLAARLPDVPIVRLLLQRTTRSPRRQRSKRVRSGASSSSACAGTKDSDPASSRCKASTLIGKRAFSAVYWPTYPKTTPVVRGE